MRKIAPIFVLFLLFVFLFMPLLTSAQSVDEILEGDLVPCTGDFVGGVSNCNLCQLLVLAQNVLNFLVAFTVVAATIMFTWAGILYVTAGPNPGNIEKAHKIFWNVLIGLVVVLIAWLVIDTIMKTLVPQDSRFGPWEKILCIPPEPRIGGPLQPPDEPGPPPPPDGEGEIGDVIASPITVLEQNNRTAFESKGIFVNNANMCSECIIKEGFENECYDIRYQDYLAKYGKHCTTISGMQIDTIDATYDIREGSGCLLTINGGTELGHADGTYSHRNGYKVDLNKDSCTTTYIKDNFRPASQFVVDGEVIDGRTGYVADNQFAHVYAVDEGTHWDIVVVEYNCLLEPLPGADRCFERKQP